MDFDSIITIIFLIIFFILPSILKQVQDRKKKKAAPKAEAKTSTRKKKEKPSIFDRIGDQIREFIRELEEQARQREKTGKEPDTLWDMFEEGQEDLHPGRKMTGEDADFDTDTDEFPAPAPPEDVEPEKTEYAAEKIRSRKEEPCISKPMRRLPDKYCFKSNPLQNAVIWSEILSKPLALRDK